MSERSNRDILVRAKALAEDILRNVGYDPKVAPVVPLGACAKYLDAPIKRVEGTRLKARGAVWATELVQAGLFGDVEIEVARSGYSGRFTLAHELAHRAADIWLGAEETKGWSYGQWKVFLDGFAGQLLLPDVTLLHSLVIPSGREIEISLELLKQLHMYFQVSFSCLIKRFSDLSTEGRLPVRNIILSAAAGVSTARRTGYAPRIIVASAPRVFFVPANTRLKSLGLAGLADLYWTGSAFVDSYLEDNCRVMSRSDWKERNLRCLFRYVIYELENRRRIMLASEVSGKRHALDKPASAA